MLKLSSVPNSRKLTRIWSVLSMVFLLLGALLGLIPSLFLLWILQQTNKSHLSDRNSWILERERLLNRCMTKEWTTYTQMQPFPMMGDSPFASEGYTPGMSDEEELKRMGTLPADLEGLGEVLYEQDMTELGLRPE